MLYNEKALQACVGKTIRKVTHDDPQDGFIRIIFTDTTYLHLETPGHMDHGTDAEMGATLYETKDFGTSSVPGNEL